MQTNSYFIQKFVPLIVTFSILTVRPSAFQHNLPEINPSNLILLPFSCDELFNQGVELYNNSQHQEALNFYFQALECYKSSGPDNSMAELGEIDSLIAIAEIYSFLGLQHNALLRYQQARALIETKDYIYSTDDQQNISIPDRIVKYQYVQVLTKIEALLVSTGDYEGAITNFDVATSALNKVGPDYWHEEQPGNIQTTYYLLNRSLKAELYLSQSSAYFALNQYENALQFSQESYEIWTDVEDVTKILTDLYIKQGILQDEGTQLFQTLRGQASALNILGASQAALLNYNDAFKTYAQATEIWKSIHDQAGEARTLYLTGLIYDSIEKDDSALSYYLDAITLLEEVQNTINIDEFTSGFSGEYIFVYENAIRLLVQSSRYKEAFYYVERAKARALINQFANTNLTLDVELSPIEMEEVESLQNQIAQIRLNIFIQEKDPSALDFSEKIKQLNMELSKSEEEYVDLLTKLKIDNLQASSLTGGNVSTVEEVQSNISSDATLIEYFVLSEKVLIFTITKDEFNVSSVIVEKNKLVDTIMDFRNFASLNEDFPDSLIQINNWLISPIKEYLHTPNLIIVPHGILHYLPFAALTDGHSYLIDQFVITAIPSASVYRYIPERESAQRETILAIGNPTTLMPNLPYAEEEAKLVARLFKSEPLINESATETKVKTLLSGKTIIHLAAHGDYNSDNPLFSSIFLAADGENDGWLEVHEIYNFKLNPDLDLVVLSGCQTNIGEISAGDDVVGLTRAFMYSGAPTVVSSLWVVDDKSTGYLMERFYKHLLNGMGKAQALQQAQLETRVRYPNPYYWSAFVINGEPGKTIPTQEVLFRSLAPNHLALMITVFSILACISLFIWLLKHKAKPSHHDME